MMEELVEVKVLTDGGRPGNSPVEGEEEGDKTWISYSKQIL